MSDLERQDIVQSGQRARNGNVVYPLVTLKNVVVFPHNSHALVIGREKMVRAIEEAMMQPDRTLVVVMQRSTEIADPQIQDIFSIGTLIEVSSIQRQQDGAIQALVRGTQRVKITELLEDEPFLHAIVSTEQELQHKGPQADALIRYATNLFERYAQLNRRFSVEDINSIVILKTLPRLSDTLAAHVITDVQQQQDLLETFDPMERLNKICVILGNEIEILELEGTIRSRVRSQVDRSQKEFYLREQLRAIQEELGMETSSEADELRVKLKEKVLPSDVAGKVRKEIDRLERTPAQSAEITVLRSYIDWVLALPWNERTEDRFDLLETRRILDADHYGLEGIKERIIEFLAVRQLRQQLLKRQEQERKGGRVGPGAARSGSQGQILCLIGPPGVGKTSLGQSIAHALGRKFARISLGGVHDEAEIRGHRRTYVGALPGRIIQSMKTVGVHNPVFLLDEIDKLSSEYRGDPAAALLEVLDPQQNSTFTDHYMEVPFDLSEVFFICTGNVKYQIPRPLADRMDIIELPGYILDEKVNIGLRYLLPKVLSEHGLTPDQLRIPQAVMQHVVTDYTREAGVRNLERQLATISRKAARRVLEKPTTRLRLTTHSLEQYLGAPRYSSAPPIQRSSVGAAMGLAVTENGGMLLSVEVVTMVGKGELLITGQLGEVMHESARAALSYIRTRTEELSIDPNFQENNDLHIHLPENALPKDGPSAGITIATAIISALTRRPVRSNLAMTGEITLLGSVLGVGGIKEKILAAHQANITHLIVPTENKNDLAEIPPKIRHSLYFTLVDNMDQVVEAALLEAPRVEEQETYGRAPLRLAAHRETHDTTDHPSNVIANEQWEQDDIDPSAFMIPPVEQHVHDSPQAHAKRDNKQN